MSVNSKRATKVKKFRGFTNAYKNVNKRQATHEDNAKNVAQAAPFLGFTAAYKNFHLNPQNYEVDGYLAGSCAAAEAYRRPSYAHREPEPTASPLPKTYDHFVPVTFKSWYEDRIRSIEARWHENDDDDDDSKSQQNSADGEKEFEMKMPTTYNCGDGKTLGGRFREFNHLPVTSIEKPPRVETRNEGILESVEKFRRRIDDESNNRRNLIDLPQKYSLDILNDRMRRLLKEDDRASSDNVGSSVRSLSSTYPRDELHFTPNPNELTEYFRLNVPASRSTMTLHFRPEKFSQWYAKFSFNYDQKYRPIDRSELSVVGNLQIEDFASWKSRTRHLIDRVIYKRREPTRSINSLKPISISDDKIRIENLNEYETTYNPAGVTRKSSCDNFSISDNPSISRCKCEI